jgi:HrpA-like RNA helicase
MEMLGLLKKRSVEGGDSSKSIELTRRGKKISTLPLPPYLATLVLEATRYGVINEVCAVISLLEAEHIFAPIKEDQLRNKLKTLIAPEGDLITFYNISREYFKNRKKGRFWCDEHGVNFR